MNVPSILVAIGTGLAVCADPIWFARRFGVGRKWLAILIKTVLLGSGLGFVFALALDLVLWTDKEFLYFALPALGAVAGYIVSAVPLFLWQIARHNCSTRDLRHMILHSRSWSDWKHDVRDDGDTAWERALERLEETVHVKYVPCGVPATTDHHAFEDWAEVIEEGPATPAWMIVPARAWLRRNRPQDGGGALIEPTNPFSAVLIAPGRARGAQRAIAAASDSQFCRDVSLILTAMLECTGRGNGDGHDHEGSTTGPVGATR